MEPEALHELSAAYALDALEPDEREVFEEHLAGCESCQVEVAELTLAAVELARAVEPAEPPPALRERILEAARAERPNVLPLRPRRVSPVWAVAAVAACVAIGLGIWNISLHSRLSDSRSAALGRSQMVPVSGVSGSLVVTPSGSAALVALHLSAAPAGKTYEAWVIHGKNAPVPAGLFNGGPGATFVPIDGKVKRGSVVAVTVEPAGGSAQPTSKPFAVSQPV
jgi:anti-sigma-K factor RskA